MVLYLIVKKIRTKFLQVYELKWVALCPLHTVMVYTPLVDNSDMSTNY